MYMHIFSSAFFFLKSPVCEISISITWKVISTCKILQKFPTWFRDIHAFEY